MFSHCQPGSHLNLNITPKAVLDDDCLIVAYDNDRHLDLGSIDERDEWHACEAPDTLLKNS